MTNPVRDPAPTLTETMLALVDDALRRLAAGLPWQRRDVVAVGMPHAVYGLVPTPMIVLTVESRRAPGPVLLGQPKKPGDGMLVVWKYIPGWTVDAAMVDDAVRRLLDEARAMRLKQAAGAANGTPA